MVTKDELAGEEEYLAKEKTAIQSVSLAVDVESKGTMESYHIIFIHVKHRKTTVLITRTFRSSP